MHELCGRVAKSVGAHRMLSPGDSVVVGCSGGADSTCLLHVLAAGLGSLGLRCTAVYVDHGLRAETEAERELVRRTAERVGAGFDWVSVDVRAHVARYGGSKQAAARELRYAALEEAADRLGANRIAVGHTLSDQAETVLLQLIRGAGTQGLAGIAPVRGRVVRPLLDVRREETLRYCQEMGLPIAEDPSNQSRRYLRNRVRLDLMPLLRDYNPAVEERLANLAEIFREEDDFMQSEAARAAESIVRPIRDGGRAGLQVDARALSSLPPALARRVVRAVARELGAGSLSFDHVEAVLASARRENGSEALEYLPGLTVRREYGRLIFVGIGSPGDAGGVRRAGSAGGEGTDRVAVSSEGAGGESARREGVPLPVGGSARADWAGLALTAEAAAYPGIEGFAASRSTSARAPGPAPTPGSTSDWAPGEREPEARFVALMDLAAVRPPLRVRPRRPGDRLAPLGLGGRKKVQDILTDAKVPRSEREKIAVVEDREGIVWVVGHALAERVRLREGTERVLRIAARPLREGDCGG